MMNTESLLNRAAEAENKMLTVDNDAEREKQKRMANIAFRKAMHMDGNPDWAGNILG